MKIVFIIAYDGAKFCGFQRQNDCLTVQGSLEKAISQIANETIEISCAGRTDAGVHGTNQVIHFSTTATRSLYSWLNGVNSLLPKNIIIKQVFLVDEDFHARFSANSRRYRYIIYNKEYKNVHLLDNVTYIKEHLNVEFMHNESQSLVGEQDFSSFRAANCQSLTPMRNVTKVSVQRYNDFVVVDIEANAFLYHMVRNIVGALLLVGKEKVDAGYIKGLLLERDRKKAPPTAAASGLYLIGVNYPDYSEINDYIQDNLGPLFL